ncbi:hypothetical protein DRO91_05430 [Candidatus Heimdallarchaeota archaeon]|nr:M23 family metallopeptidase [Candidatus Heimdallarchaeota archaeon]RLI69833.1 MAG: hypothetical protein DRP02_09670 [Candidatus Gerdarchaeota archaeon]RLI71640.1 MAG: hypothetical protein DRO91_05430 [Candidatus Heimdallarchaeota archaeon]
MKKGAKITLFIFLGFVVLSGIFIPIAPYIFHFNPKYGTPSLEFPMLEPMNITRLAAYHTPDWGEPGKFHNGIDLAINGPTKVISPCYGWVTRIRYNINPYAGNGEVAMIHVSIMINYAWSVKLVFEPWANTTEFREKQLAAIIVKPGMFVTPGDLIGTLLYNYQYPHLHYMVMKFERDVCPYTFSSPTAKSIFEDIAERTNSTICYP